VPPSATTSKPGSEELAKLEEQRVQAQETQATAVLTVVIAIAAFGASAINGNTLRHHTVSIGVVVLLLLIAVGFAIAARLPRAIRLRLWSRRLPHYASLEQRLTTAEAALRDDLDAGAERGAILESWRARRAVANYLAEAKALWLTCSLACVFVAFIAAGVSALEIVY
jgi:hypothetical protein